MDSEALRQAKQAVRKQIRALKILQSDADKRRQSSIILQKLACLQSFVEAQCVMMYWSLPDEVDTHDFVVQWAATKKILLPSVQGDELVLKVFSSMHDMKQGESFGIMEPCGEDFTAYESIDMIVVPGVAFDIAKNRLGRGKAFYDKFLRLTSAIKIGICCDYQLLENVPAGPMDFRMDMVISTECTISD